MGEFKTIISANIPVRLAERLNKKTKGTRSRVITRALEAYLNDMEAFDISDVSTGVMLIELYHRTNEFDEFQIQRLRQLYLEVRV